MNAHRTQIYNKYSVLFYHFPDDLIFFIMDFVGHDELFDDESDVEADVLMGIPNKEYRRLNKYNREFRDKMLYNIYPK